MKRAIYPGSFDPVTKGHLNIVSRASLLFDELIVAVYEDSPKNLLFSTEERVQLFEQVVAEAGLDNVLVRSYRGLTVECAKVNNAQVIVRGIRAFEDFVYEADMAVMNRKMAPDIEAIMLMTHLEYSYISSSRVKELAKIGVSVEDLAPRAVIEALQTRFSGT